ncbi:MAG TPA: hypothetical protein VFZ78_11815 [Flavisolibacter sp.]
MHIRIHDEITLGALQEVFSSFYPYLQLHFYRHHHKVYEPSEPADTLDPATRIADLKHDVTGIMEIQPFHRVADIEQEFRNHFGLSVQVLWNRNNTWEQTTGTDAFTLKELNEFARTASDETVLEEYEEGFEAEDDRPQKLL